METTDPLKVLNNRLDAFVKQRDWNQFHSVKNLVASISIESAELSETVQWSNPSVEEVQKDRELTQKIAHETADVMMYCLRLCSVLGLDPIAIMNEKFELNEQKYPADLVRGSSAKYTTYQ
ncbi:MAG: nucleotide pyrophosphohydrolase [Candidatus Poseidoniaceae archaeon]|nr:nucleotide pyrophosphohydrolase [Candidatus Poseidoniaceae archaeon]|tara:strand:- start:419 stop:781 length:363 start_codon:yes stop_codon:yes gene_type:complete